MLKVGLTYNMYTTNNHETGFRPELNVINERMLNAMSTIPIVKPWDLPHPMWTHLMRVYQEHYNYGILIMSYDLESGTS